MWRRIIRAWTEGGIRHSERKAAIFTFLKGLSTMLTPSPRSEMSKPTRARVKSPTRPPRPEARNAVVEKASHACITCSLRGCETSQSPDADW